MTTNTPLPPTADEPASAAPALKVHESTGADGSLHSLFLVCDGGRLAIRSGETTRPLRVPGGALEAVMDRYGAPLEPEERARLLLVGTLPLGGGRSLRHVRHLARWDVIARDYLVYEDPSTGTDPSCALATTVAGALEHLARAAATEERS